MGPGANGKERASDGIIENLKVAKESFHSILGPLSGSGPGAVCPNCPFSRWTWTYSHYLVIKTQLETLKSFVFSKVYSYIC